ncbi:MAG: MucR family transcriptional regulator [Pseudomonadota bacterium]
MERDRGRDEQQDESLVALTADIVSAYVSKNDIGAQDVPQLIGSVHAALRRASEPDENKPSEMLRPAVPVKKSVTPDYIICLEDGEQFKSLKRHLRTRYNLSPDEYREKWNLPNNYPMVAPNYAKARSQLAKKMGLGTRGK